jgi:hypothetical protein
MILDDALANGLAGRFIRDNDSKLSTVSQAMETRTTKGVHSARAIEKLASSLRSQKGYLLFYEGGKGYKKYIFQVMLFHGDLNPSKGWKEEGLYAVVDIWNFRNLGAKHPFKDIVLFHISKHCIKRIIERSFDKASGEISEIYNTEKIYSEMKPLALWHSIWNSIRRSLVMASSKDIEDSLMIIDSILQNFSIYVPTTNGVLFCNLNRGTLCVRTYLHDDQLSETQAKIKQQLYTVTQLYCSKEVAIFVHIKEVLNSSDEFALSMILNTLANQVLLCTVKNFVWFGKDISEKECETILALAKSHLAQNDIDTFNDLLKSHKPDEVFSRFKKLNLKMVHEKMKIDNL